MYGHTEWDNLCHRHQPADMEIKCLANSTKSLTHSHMDYQRQVKIIDSPNTPPGNKLQVAQRTYVTVSYRLACDALLPTEWLYKWPETSGSMINSTNTTECKQKDTK